MPTLPPPSTRLACLVYFYPSIMFGEGFDLRTWVTPEVLYAVDYLRFHGKQKKDGEGK